MGRATLAGALLALQAAVIAAGSPWPASAINRAAAKLAQLQLNDKLALLHGYGGSYVGDVPAFASLGLPPINLEDGPQGVADGATLVTAWPSALTVAMSWDRDAMFAWGAAMGAEQKTKGTNVMLGPGINLARTPWCGRNFEYQGEDPYLASQLVAPEVQGIQSNNVSACIKHYTVNAIEQDRSGMNVVVDQRTWMETYSRGFQAAVDAGVGTAMCSYNRVNGSWACENPETLGYLFGPLGGFKGWMMSDWGATHSTVAAANAGLTQEMPSNDFFGPALASAVSAGQVSEEQIDTMAMRILTPLFALNLVDDPPTGTLAANATSAAHNILARELAEASIALLKNDGGILPLNPKEFKSILVLGDATTVTGWGSGGVVLPYTVTPYQGIAEYLNGPLPPRPVNCTYTADVDFYQPGNPCVSAASAQDCCAQCSGRVDCNAFTFVPSADCATPPASATQGSSHHRAAAPAAHGSKPNRKGRAGSKLLRTPAAAQAGGACWIKPDNSGSTPHTGYTSGTCAPQPAPAGAWTVVYNATQDAAVAAALAAKFDVVVMNVATTSGEGSDRPNLDLPAWQDAMVTAVVSANKNTVVVARCPGACTMPWRDEAPAILFQLLPGQEAGNALANALFGDVNPSGKLPVSFPASMNDTWLGNPVNPAQYPGVPLNGEAFPTATFTEGMFFGYRWYDQQGTDPLWPFGHGLSYTSFGYSGLRVAGVASSTSNASVSITLTNTGGMAGSEVVQLYLGFPASTGEPPKVLRGFEKVKGMAAGAAATVIFAVTAEEVQMWDTAAQAWTITPGTYSVYVGSSSRDIRLTGSLTVQA